jgi:ankyrin repeat protein
MSAGSSKGSGFFDFLFDILRNQEAAAEIDSILLDLRCRGLMSHSPREISKIVFMTVPFTWLFLLLLLPLNILASITANIRPIILSLLISFIPFYLLDGFTLFDYLILSLICLILYNIKEVSQSALIFILDIIDLVSAGHLTKIFLKYYNKLDINHKRSLTNDKNTRIISHIFNTRQLLRDNITSKWEDYFVSILKYFPEDKNLLKIEIDRYWNEVGHTDSIYNNYSPIYLSDHLDWIEIKHFHRATLATLRLVLRNLDDIDRLQVGYNGNGYTRRLTLLGTALMANVPLAFIKEIVEAGADVNFLETDDFTGEKFPIIYNAISNSSVEVVDYLLGAGADISKANAAAHLTIYQHAILWAKEIATLELLLDASNPDNFQDKRGNGLFHYAAASAHDRTAFMQVLLERNHDINAINNNGLTPLGEAASFDLAGVIWGAQNVINLQNIIFLKDKIKKGIIVNDNNDTFLHIFIKDFYNGEDEIANEIIEYFMNEGLNINHQNDDGETILMLASRRNKLSITKQILIYNPDLKIKNNIGWTAFEGICKKKFFGLVLYEDFLEYIELVELFLDKGENIYQRDELNRTFAELIDLSLNDALEGGKETRWLTDEEWQKGETIAKRFLRKLQGGTSSPRY